MKFFYDTNILVYMSDTRDAAKQRRAAQHFEQSFRSSQVVLSTQVLHELINVITRKIKPNLSLEQITERLQGFFQLELISSDAMSIQAALRLMQQYQTSWWDALILEAALRADADVLVSEDFSHGQRFGKLVAWELACQLA
jgi:predicted nucleic acid-binding protein